MKILLLVFSLSHLLLHKASSQLDMIEWVNIDCGNEDLPPINADLLLWKLDTNFTTTGIKARLTVPTPRGEMDTLRFFPDATAQNCYTIPSVKLSLKYLIRAGFYYGNYDGQGKPPAFDLRLDGKKWATVNTTTAEGMVYYEVVYVTEGKDWIELCLVQIRNGEVPFISSIEMVPLWNALYTEMGSESSFSLVRRSNFGGPELRNGILSGELHNRIWTAGADPPNVTVAATVAPLLTQTENDPPIAALTDSIQPNNAGDTLSLTVNIPKADSDHQTAAYLVFYFTELLIRPNFQDTRIMDIYVDGKMMTSVDAELAKCKVATLYPVAVRPSASINVTVVKSNSSTLPPMISAMEVFTKIESSGAGGSGSNSNPGGGAGKRHVVAAFCVVFIHAVSVVFVSLF